MKTKPKWNKQRCLSVLLSIIMVFTMFSGIIPGTVTHVHAGWVTDYSEWCDGCGEWRGLCGDCNMCYSCCMDVPLHCVNCGTCFDYNGDFCGSCFHCSECVLRICDHCEKCNECSGTDFFCESCGNCYECADGWCAICNFCSECVTQICSSCGNYCSDCVDNFCPLCDKCDECTGTEIYCEDCGACEVCAELCVVCWKCGDCTDLCESCGKFCHDHEGEVNFCPECDRCDTCYGSENACKDCGTCSDCAAVCEDCGEHCAECAEIFCSNCSLCGDCTTVCPLCEEACGQCVELCANCDACELCAEICFGNGDYCSECAELCPNCGFCDDCVIFCDNCVDYCSDCSVLCPNCNFCEYCSGRCQDCEDYCSECADLFCGNCYLCGECTVICPFCEDFCRECADMCPDCDACEGCADICIRCGDYCSECTYFCDKCGLCEHCTTICTNCEDYCGECAGLCGGCDACEYCAVFCKDCGDACSECSWFCYKCRLCPDCCLCYGGPYALSSPYSDLMPSHNLHWERNGSGTVRIWWNGNPGYNNGKPVTKYQYRYGEGSYSTFANNDLKGYVQNWTDIPGSNADTREFILDGLTNGRQYFVEVRAVNVYGDGYPLHTGVLTQALPGAPVLTAKAGAGNVTLSWTGLDSGGLLIAGYDVSYGPTAGYVQNWGAPFTSYDNPDGSFTIYNLDEGVEYTFEIRARNVLGWGPASNRATATPASGTVPGAPRNLTASAHGNPVVTLNCKVPDNGGATILKYEVSYGPTVGYTQNWIERINNNLGNVLIEVDGLNYDVEYTFEVRAVNKYGPGPSSGTVTCTPDKGDYFEVTVTDPDVPNRETYYFMGTEAGYDPVDPTVFTLTSTGTLNAWDPLDYYSLGITLDGADALCFTKVAGFGWPVAGPLVGESTTFSLKPNDDLAKGVYTATINIYIDYFETPPLVYSFDVVFAVGMCPNCGSDTGTLCFNSDCCSDCAILCGGCGTCAVCTDVICSSCGDSCSDCSEFCDECDLCETCCEGHCEHEWGEWQKDDTGHWQLCDLCNQRDGYASHVLSDWLTDTAATCTTTGSRHLECVVCGEVTVTQTTAVIAHTPGDWVADLPATHTAAGSQHKECSVCREVTDTGTIPAAGHTWGTWQSNGTGHWRECSCGETDGFAAHHPSGWKVDAPVTHAAAGSRHKECTICGYLTETESIPAIGHTWSAWKTDGTNHWKECSCGEKNSEAAHTGEWIVDKSATHKAAGSRHKDCTVCGYTEKETIPVISHTWGTWKNDGKNHWHECSCGEKNDLTAHTYSAWVNDVYATHTTTGSRHRDCTACGYIDSITVATVGHTFGSAWVSDGTNHWHECSGCTEKGSFAAHTPGDWLTDVAATATTDGSKHKECTVCEYITETGVIPKTGESHTHTWATVWSKDGTNHWHECSVCGEKKDLAAHTPGDWLTDVAATATTDGSKHKECTACGYITETGVIPKTGESHTHTWATTWSKDGTNHWHECSGCGEKKDIAAHTPGDWLTDVAATATTDGSKHKECTACGYITETGVIPKTGESHTHTWATTWSKDGTNHWHECPCGEKEPGSEASHTPGTWIVDLAATETATGNQHKECTVCGHTTAAETIPAIGTTGPGAIKDTLTDAVFVFAGNFLDLDKVWLNGKELVIDRTDPSKFLLSGYPGYTGTLGDAVSGSVVITLYKEFLATLPNGTYNLMVSFKEGDVPEPYATPETVFIIDRETPKGDTPVTGDNSNMMLWLLMCGASLTVLGGLTVTRIRRKYCVVSK